MRRLTALLVTAALAAPVFAQQRSGQSSSGATRQVPKASSLFTGVRPANGVREVNLERSAGGVAKLRADARLSAAAQDLAGVIAATGVFDECVNVETPGGRAQRFGYPNNAGASIARGFGGWAEVVAAWMESTNARNVLAPEYVAVGTASVNVGDTTVYVAVFGR